MGLQLNIFLLLFGGVQGLLFSLFLFRKKLHNSAYVYLLLYLGVMLLQITFKVMSKIWLMQNWSVIYAFSYYLPLLYGPLIYLFAKHFLQKQAFSLKEAVHFIPAFIAFTLIVIGNNNSRLPQGLDFIFFYPASRMIILLTSLLAYHWMAYRIWKKHQHTMKHFATDTASLQMNWVKQFVMVSAVASTLVVLALFLLYMNYPNGHQYRYGFVGLSICIYWFSYTALTRPSVFSVVKGYAKESTATDFPAPQLKVYKPSAKYANSALNEEEAQTICTKLDKLMSEQKVFLQPDLTINQLANALSCSRHHLSQVLNDKLQQSYYDYINCLRINEAKYLLNDSKYQQHKIASIAYDAGFNSLSTFNEVFKKQTGKTPSDYRKETLKELQKQRV